MLIELGLDLHSGGHDRHCVKLGADKDAVEDLVLSCWLIVCLDVLADPVLSHLVPCLCLAAQSTPDWSSVWDQVRWQCSCVSYARICAVD